MQIPHMKRPVDSFTGFFVPFVEARKSGNPSDCEFGLRVYDHPRCEV